MITIRWSQKMIGHEISNWYSYFVPFYDLLRAIEHEI